ncbi:hypothetical protein Zmor_025876 [Zophobas morio]|uniref:Uncharacterized protein n=1 Tax=Zophobas morio TaxID=2755281 RepID=A0AA38M4N6_9CUCU|nr:hypothetical protein Zmor_025876 [Zophobas morio]
MALRSTATTKIKSNYIIPISVSVRLQPLLFRIKSQPLSHLFNHHFYINSSPYPNFSILTQITLSIIAAHLSSCSAPEYICSSTETFVCGFVYLRRLITRRRPASQKERGTGEGSSQATRFKAAQIPSCRSTKTKQRRQ